MPIKVSDRQKIIVESAIGATVEIPGDAAELAKLLFEGALDAYCPKCKCNSVFKISGPDYRSDREKAASDLPKYGVVTVTGRCQRDDVVVEGYQCNEPLYVCFKRSENKLIKIGQAPSRAELDFGTLDAAFRELDSDFRSELGRAIGLRAHGVGINSFVYLRRIFEALLEQAHAQSRTSAGWNEDEYSRARVQDRITLLHASLPSRLVQSAPLYGILSKGVHELSEEECLELFDPILQAIHFILAERREKKEFERTIKTLKEKRASMEVARTPPPSRQATRDAIPKK